MKRRSTIHRKRHTAARIWPRHGASIANGVSGTIEPLNSELEGTIGENIEAGEVWQGLNLSPNGVLWPAGLAPVNYENMANASVRPSWWHGTPAGYAFDVPYAEPELERENVEGLPRKTINTQYPGGAPTNRPNAPPVDEDQPIIGMPLRPEGARDQWWRAPVALAYRAPYRMRPNRMTLLMARVNPMASQTPLAARIFAGVETNPWEMPPHGDVVPDDLAIGWPLHIIGGIMDHRRR